MCGITGYVGFSDAGLLERMCGCLIHRGPDEDGFFNGPTVALAMRRLAVIDLETGSQPITNESGDIWVVFNGEIYNYEVLREELKKRGHILATSSDTETIVHLYEDEGLEFVHRLRGMFAIAIWDAREQRLVLVRDRIGEKPLFYATNGDRLYFGSEIKAILQAPVSRNIDPQAVCEFLAAGYVPGSRTFYDGISKLPPGHILVWRAGKALVRPYWHWHRSHKSQSAPSFSSAAGQLSERLDETVRLCLKSDVEVGAFLSGGIDSSVIVALSRKHVDRIKTFSVGYGGDAKGFNELHYARRVADYLGTKHYELILEARSNIELLPRILWHYDEPHGEPTSVLVYLLCKFTREHVKVALGGTGGDEIFCGYPRHAGIRMLEYYRRFPAVLRKYVVERIVAKWPESTQGNRFAKRAKRFISGADLPPERAYLTWVSLLHPDIRHALLSDQLRSQSEDSSGDRFLRDHLLSPSRDSLFDKITALDIDGYLPEYQLAYMDRMSMAHGLEVRSPLCDFELVDHVISLPHSYRLNRLRSKHIFKETAKQWIPSEIAERRKVGFDSPIGQWFKGELRNFLVSFLSSDQVDRSGLLESRSVQQLIRDHLSGFRDYSLQLWSILALEGWYRMYIEDGITQGEDYRLLDMRGAVSRL